MSRIGIFNLAWGFALIFVAACGGAFVALQLSENFVNSNHIPNWQSVLQASSHGHTSLFGLIHIVFGLTTPYTKCTSKISLLKSIGIFMGSLAMGPLLLIRAAIGPTLSTEFNGLILGACLSCALLAIFVHSVNLFQRINSRL